MRLRDGCGGTCGDGGARSATPRGGPGIRRPAYRRGPWPAAEVPDPPHRPGTLHCRDRTVSGHAASADVSSESKLSSEPSTSPAARRWRAGGLHSSKAAPPPCIGSRRSRTSGRVFLPPLDRDDHEIWSLLAPVGETHPEAQTRRDRGISASLRFRGARSRPVTPEVGAAASPPMALPLRASAAARDTPQSGARKRAPSHDVSRPSRRGPPQQRHADCGLPVEDAGWGGKSEIRNSARWERSNV